MKVFIVEEGDYEQRGVRAVFSSLEKAVPFAASIGEQPRNILEFEVDEEAADSARENT